MTETGQQDEPLCAFVEPGVIDQLQSTTAPAVR